MSGLQIGQWITESDLLWGEIEALGSRLWGSGHRIDVVAGKCERQGQVLVRVFDVNERPVGLDFPGNVMKGGSHE